MNKTVHKSKPSLKACEWSAEQGGNAYISFEEYLNIPGLEDADIRIEFDKNNSFDDIRELVAKLKKNGFTFVVQRPDPASNQQQYDEMLHRLASAKKQKDLVNRIKKH